VYRHFAWANSAGLANDSFQRTNSIVVRDAWRRHHFVLLYFGSLHGQGDVGFEHAI
jgi:hypothetical protein